MDAVAFIWKRLGTTCETLPEAHLLLRAFNAVCRHRGARRCCSSRRRSCTPTRSSSTSTLEECQLSYNPLQMALIWEALATRDVALLAAGARAPARARPPACAWVNYVRSHDDIGWTFADEDAAELGIDGYDHRRFLNAFYVNRFPGSFARGRAVPGEPADRRLPGLRHDRLARGRRGGRRRAACERMLLAHSIALSTGGVPLLYLGDEVGQLNDYGYLADPEARGRQPLGEPARRTRPSGTRSATDPTTTPGAIYRGLRRLIELRRRPPSSRAAPSSASDTHNPHVLGYQRPGADERRARAREPLGGAADPCGRRPSPRCPAAAHDLVTARRSTSTRTSCSSRISSAGCAWESDAAAAGQGVTGRACRRPSCGTPTSRR